MRFLARSRAAFVIGGLLSLALIVAVPARSDVPPAAAGGAAAAAKATPAGTLPASWVQALRWRSIGPANMSGRITAISIYEADPAIWYIATASGGLVKTTNNGVTFQHCFDQEATVSIGDVCVAPSNPDIVWVGTGEANPRNSVSYGDGVYKSTDGGKSWKNMGLKNTFQIGKIKIHPTNPDVVYVGALGRLYGPNEERGLFKTTDGGRSWTKIHYIDERTGVIDMIMHPTDPDTLIIATWERQRDGFDSHIGEPRPDGYDIYDPSVKWARGSGLFKTTDGGRSWTKLTRGLPTGLLGRIGLDWYRKDPNIVFAIVDCDGIGKGTPPSQIYMGIVGETAASGGARLTQITANSPASKAGLRAGDVVVRVDKQPLKTYPQLTALIPTRKAGDKLTLEVLRDGKSLSLVVTLENRPTAGGTQVPERLRGAYLLGAVGATENSEVVLQRVQSGGAADKAGLKEGDVIKKIDGRDLKEWTELLNALGEKKEGDRVKLTVVRDKEMTVEVALFMAPFGMEGSSTRPYMAQLAGQQPNVQDRQGPNGHEYGGVYKSTDGGESWTRINSVVPRPMYFQKIRVDPSDDRYLYVLGVQMYRSSDGGKTFTPDASRGVHADQHALWINPRDGRHMIVGTDGGFYVTYDRTANWDHLNTLALGQFYHVAVSANQPYYVYGGLQDNGTWGGPSRTLNATGPINEDWLSIGGGDGFVCRVDPFDPDLIYSESQNGFIRRRNLRTGEFRSIRPQPPRGQPPYRFNWNTPFILSHHNPAIFYCGGNYVFRSVQRGDNLRVISPEITLTKRGSATALAESPRNPDVLWVGTDDGALWITRDGGKNWTNLTTRLIGGVEIRPDAKRAAELGVDMPHVDQAVAAATARYARTANLDEVCNLAVCTVNGRTVRLVELAEVKAARGLLPGPRWVATIEPSRFVEGRCYVCFDAHRSNDDEPYLLVTEDFGQTWKSIRANLPWGSSRCLREDIVNPDLLYCGTEFFCFASIDRGQTWTKINNNLPTVAIHEVAIHPTAGEIVVATHGRSLWVLDVTVLRQIKPETLTAAVELFAPANAIRWRTTPTRGGTNRRFVGQNPSAGVNIYYTLGQKAESVSLKIVDVDGKLVRTLQAANEPGLNRATWLLTRQQEGKPPAKPAKPTKPTPQEVGPPAPPGVYRVVLTVDGKEYTRTMKIENDPRLPPDALPEEEEEPMRPRFPHEEHLPIVD